MRKENAKKQKIIKPAQKRGRYMLSNEAGKTTISFSANEIDEIIKWHDCEMALLFLFCHRYPFSEDDVAKKLIWTIRQVKDTKEKLDRIGLGKAVVTAPELDRSAVDKILAFPVEDLSRYYLYTCAYGAKDDRHAASILNCSKEHIADLKKKLSYLGLADSVEADEENGEDYSSNHAFDSPALNPVENSLPTTEEGTPASEAPKANGPGKAASASPPEFQKDQVPDPKAERKDLVRLFAAQVNIQDRQLNPMERKYIISWIDYGFRDPEIIGIAYRRTVKNQGAFRWAYANAIIKSWNNQNLFTTADILEYDKRHRSTSSASKAREAQRAARKKTEDQLKGSGVTAADYDFESALKQMRRDDKTKKAPSESEK